MDQMLLLRASETLEQLSDAENLILEAATSGQEASTVATLEIRAELIEFLCTHQEVQTKIHRHGLSLNGFIIKGFLDLVDANVSYPLQFRNCTFTEQIWLKSARLRALAFRNCQLNGLNADSTVIQTNFLMIEASRTTGEVTFREANIGGSFRTDGSIFTGVNSPALVCDRAKISGGVFLATKTAKSIFNGETRFVGVEVGGNFDCEGASFLNKTGNALNAERIQIGGSLFLRGSHAEGEMVVAASRIGVALDCTGAKFESDGERTLNAERATIGSHVLLVGYFSCNKKVHLLAADIEGGLRCRLAKIGKLDLRHTTVKGPFEWADMIEPSESTIDFRDSRLESVKDDEVSWPKTGCVQFDGFRYERFSDSVTDLATRLRWLALDTSRPAQAYRQLSLVYERGGHSDLARQVLFVFENLRRSGQRGVIANVSNFLLRWTIGYGYRLWQAAVWMLVLTVVGAVLGVVGYRTKLIAPTDGDANALFVATGRTPTQYPRFSASIYSIEHSLPVINLGVASSWSADTSAQWPDHGCVQQTIRLWFWIQTILGWLLSIFFIAGLTGVVKTVKT